MLEYLPKPVLVNHMLSRPRIEASPELNAHRIRSYDAEIGTSLWINSLDGTPSGPQSLTFCGHNFLSNTLNYGNIFFVK